PRPGPTVRIEQHPHLLDRQPTPVHRPQPLTPNSHRPGPAPDLELSISSNHANLPPLAPLHRFHPRHKQRTLHFPHHAPLQPLRPVAPHRHEHQHAHQTDHRKNQQRLQQREPYPQTRSTRTTHDRFRSTAITSRRLTVPSRFTSARLADTTRIVAPDISRRISAASRIVTSPSPFTS